MKTMKKSCLAILLTMMFIITLLPSMGAEAASGAWKKDSKGYYYQFSDGTCAKSEYINGYWLSPNGYWTYKAQATWRKSVKGWWYGDTKGWYAKDQWLKINQKWYHFNKAGYMEVSTWIGSNYVDENGVWDSTKTKPAGKIYGIKDLTVERGITWNVFMVKLAGLSIVASDGSSVSCNTNKVDLYLPGKYPVYWKSDTGITATSYVTVVSDE